jgi:hypothetical protein
MHDQETQHPSFGGDLPARGGSSSDLTGQHLGDKTWLPGMRFGYGAIAGS